MELIQVIGESVTLTFTKQELEIVNNALNEICNGVDIQEFETRIGATPEAAEALLKAVNRVLQRTRS
jgi:hypothetical protein